MTLAPQHILKLGAVGEILVGILATVLPGPVMSFLLAAPMIGDELIVTRIAGIAIFALGATWWKTSSHIDPGRLRDTGAGFLVYNAGIGVVFLVHAWPGEGWLWVPLGVAVAHLAAGLAYAIAAAKFKAARGAG